MRARVLLGIGAGRCRSLDAPNPLVAGWSLAISAPLILTGYSFLIAAGVPAYLGTAWMAALRAGLIMIIGGLEARKRLSSTWYWTRPELL